MSWASCTSILLGSFGQLSRGLIVDSRTPNTPPPDGTSGTWCYMGTANCILHQEQNRKGKKCSVIPTPQVGTQSNKRSEYILPLDTAYHAPLTSPGGRQSSSWGSGCWSHHLPVACRSIDAVTQHNERAVNPEIPTELIQELWSWIGTSVDAVFYFTIALLFHSTSRERPPVVQQCNSSNNALLNRRFKTRTVHIAEDNIPFNVLPWETSHYRWETAGALCCILQTLPTAVSLGQRELRFMLCQKNPCFLINFNITFRQLMFQLEPRE